MVQNFESHLIKIRVIPGKVRFWVVNDGREAFDMEKGWDDWSRILAFVKVICQPHREENNLVGLELAEKGIIGLIRV